MTDYDRVINGFSNMFYLIRTSKNPACKKLVRNAGWITGHPFIKMVCKQTEKSQYNVIRVYAPTNRGNIPWFDLTYSFSQYVEKPNAHKVVLHNDQLITWINLEDNYIMFYIEPAPQYETRDNTKTSDLEEDDIFEYLTDEAAYFNVRIKELSSPDKEAIRTSELKPPPKYDSY